MLLSATSAMGQLNAGPSPTRVCVLDEGVLMARSSLAAAMAARFREVRETAQRRFDGDARMLDADDRSFAARRAALPAMEADRQRADLAARRSELKQRGERINRDLADLDKELTRSVVRLALPTIRIVEAERRCAMVVASRSLVDVADPTLDISQQVVAMMNAASPVRR